MADHSLQQDGIVTFIRRRDFQVVKDLGQGACGRTILLRDDLIDEHFVCKKYVPFSEDHRQELFAAFTREIKLLHKVYHENVVRIFNYFLYPSQFTGYILMEYADGLEVDDFLKKNPERINETFLQAVSGFAYLERHGILHRDIRPGNIMVRADGIVKIIDLGFGKQIRGSADFDKSISLNWWCQTPNEFSEGRYDFATEVYFVGKLFEEIIQTNRISHFQYTDLLRRMCDPEPATRTQNFTAIEQETRNHHFAEISFRSAELVSYRAFANSLAQQISKIDFAAKYIDDPKQILMQLSEAYRRFMLEEHVPNSSTVIKCFISGSYYYKNRSWIAVSDVKNFLDILSSCTEEKRRIIIANLHTKLDTVPRFSAEAEAANDIPF